MTAEVLAFDQAAETAKRYHQAYVDDAIEMLRSAGSFIVLAFSEDTDETFGDLTPMFHCNSQQMALAGALLLRLATETRATSQPNKAG